MVRASEKQKIVVSGSALEETIELLKQISRDDLAPVQIKSSYMEARLYYVFETKEKGKLLDVAMWGEWGGTYVNGVEFKWADIYYDITLPFLPEDTAELWKKERALE